MVLTGQLIPNRWLNRHSYIWSDYLDQINSILHIYVYISYINPLKWEGPDHRKIETK